MNMNTTRNGMTPRNSRKMPRRGRGNPARQEAVPVGEWEADVVAKRDGRTNAALRRKVKTVGIKQLDVCDLLEEARIYLRKGYEVRLGKDIENGVRFYPIASRDCKSLYLCAQPIGSTRNSLDGMEVGYSRYGLELDDDEIAKEAEKCRKECDKFKRSFISVTPDTMVTCPKCGTEIRVGKMAA